MDIYHLKELLIGIDIKKKPCEEGPKPGLFAVYRGVENPSPPFFRGMIVVRFLKFQDSQEPEPSRIFMEWFETNVGFVSTAHVVVTLPETHIFRSWKWMVGIRSFPFGMAYFQGRLLLVSGSVFMLMSPSIDKQRKRTDLPEEPLMDLLREHRGPPETHPNQWNPDAWLRRKNLLQQSGNEHKTLKKDSWETTFLLGWPSFRGYVSFREGR